MARKYEYTTGRYAWTLETCEEELLIAGYDDISRFIPPDQAWRTSFENHFFEHGNGLAFDYLDAINAVRRRRGLEVIVIRETDVFDYGRSPDKLLKSNQRRRVREELKSASIHVRQRRVDLAKAQMEKLPDPHLTFEEWKTQYQRQTTGSDLTFRELTNRLLAQQAASATPIPAKPTLPFERGLSIASPNLRREIISKLPADDALDIAERIADVELRDALVRHALGRAA